MEIKAVAKKGKGIEDLIRSYKFDIIEDAKPLTFSRSIISEVIEKYVELLETPGSYHYGWAYRDYGEGELNEPIRKLPFILTPQDITLFFTSASAFEEHEKSDHLLNPFLCKLLYNSYYAGHNDFFFDLRGFAKTPSLFEELNGYKQDEAVYLRIALKGKAQADTIATYGHYLEISFLDDCFCKQQLAFQISRCVFTFHGELQLGERVRPKKLNFKAYKCQYKTGNESTLQKLLEGIESGHDHKIYFIHPTGEEKLVREDSEK